MNNKSVHFILTGLTLALTTQTVFAQSLITTDESSCESTGTPVVAVPGGTSQDVIDSSIPEWQDLGFTIGSISPDENIIVCTDSEPDENELTTPEQEGLDQSASAATLAVSASIIQTTNLYTRLAAIRRQSYSATTSTADTGGGASADDPSLFDERLNFFANGSGSLGDQESSQVSSGFDFDTIGTTIGVDYRLTEHFSLGTAFGYTSGNTSMNNDLGHTDIDNYSLSFYGGYSLPSSFYVEGLFNVGWNNYDSQRNVQSDIDGSTIEQVSSDYSGNNYSLSLATGYEYTIDAFSITPLFRFDYVHVDIDKYQETGDSIVNRIDAQHVDSVRTAFGAWLQYTIQTPYAVLIPAMRAEWQHEYMNDSRLLTSYQNGSKTQLRTDSPDRDFANLSFGFSALFPYGVSAFFFYETMLANHLTTLHSFNGGLQLQF